MGYKLVAEVLDNAPVDLTSTQLLLLVVLAESARDKDRTAKFKTSHTALADRIRKSPGSVRNELSVLTRRGLIKPLLRGQKGTTQHYYLVELHAHHRNATVR